VVRPDVSVVCVEVKDYIKEAPEVVVEVVSKSTAKKDEYLKFELYQKEKVEFYILAYPEIQKLKAFRLKGGKYDKMFEGDGGVLQLKLKNGCEINIPVAKLFK